MVLGCTEVVSNLTDRNSPDLPRLQTGFDELNSRAYPPKHRKGVHTATSTGSDTNGATSLPILHSSVAVPRLACFSSRCETLVVGPGDPSHRPSLEVGGVRVR